MEKVKWVVVFVGLFLLKQSLCFAQQKDIIRKGLLRTQATISPSYLFSQKQSLFYLHGNFEGYVSNKISLSGDAFYHVGSSNGSENIVRFNHSILFGGNYHFIKNNNDLYLGIQPGINFTKLSDTKINNPQLGINPVFSFVAGYNFFVNPYFHFFVQGRLMAGAHHYNQFINLTEMRLSAGLGFNINSIKLNNKRLTLLETAPCC